MNVKTKVTRKHLKIQDEITFFVVFFYSQLYFTHEKQKTKLENIPAVLPGTVGQHLHPIEHCKHPVCTCYFHIARKQTLVELFPARQPSQQRNARRESRRAKAFLLRPPPVVSCPLCAVIISYWPGWCLTMNSISALQRRKQPPCLRRCDTIQPLDVVLTCRKFFLTIFYFF